MLLSTRRASFLYFLPGLPIGPMEARLITLTHTQTHKHTNTLCSHHTTARHSSVQCTNSNLNYMNIKSRIVDTRPSFPSVDHSIANKHLFLSVSLSPTSCLVDLNYTLTLTRTRTRTWPPLPYHPFHTLHSSFFFNSRLSSLFSRPLSIFSLSLSLLSFLSPRRGVYLVFGSFPLSFHPSLCLPSFSHSSIIRSILPHPTSHSPHTLLSILLTIPPPPFSLPFIPFVPFHLQFS